MANNPTLDTLTEIFDYNTHLKQQVGPEQNFFQLRFCPVLLDYFRLCLLQGRKDEIDQVLCVLSLGTGRQPMLAVPR